MQQENQEKPVPLPNLSEGLGSVRNDSEGFRTIPNRSERGENHTLTVREVARMFEAAGVARTERSIVNWCQPNSQGVARLDAYFDPNERKYFITPQSVEQAVAEEKAKAARSNLAVPTPSEKSRETHSDDSEGDFRQVGELRKEIFDLKINNRAKDFIVERLQQQQEANVSQLMAYSRKVGELETRLLQLSPPRGEGSEDEN